MGFLKRKKVLGFIFLVVLIIFIVLLARRDGDIVFDSVLVERLDVVETVEVTGRVKPASEIDLAFEKGGLVNQINFSVGDKAVAGDVVIELFNADVKAQLSQAQAAARAEGSVLTEFVSGTRLEEITLQETKVLSASTSLSDSAQSLADTVLNSFTQADDAILNKADQFFVSPQSGAPKMAIATFGNHTLPADRVAIGDMLRVWQNSLNLLSVNGDLSGYVNTAKLNLNTIKSFLDELAIHVNRSGTETEKTTLFTARSNVDKTITNLVSAEENYNLAVSNLQVEQEQLALKLAGKRGDQINTQQAIYDKFIAQVAELQAVLEKTKIIAPIDGLVTRIDTEVGEIVPAAEVVAEIISDSNFEVEVNIPEIDIANMGVGNLAEITLDTYGNDVIFNAHVKSIDPVATVLDGVPTYKTTLQFDNQDERILSGMTANVEITTEVRNEVLAIPARSVIRKGGAEIVRIYEGGEIKEVEVKTGIRGSLGLVEIISGIEEGQTVITVLREDN